MSESYTPSIAWRIFRSPIVRRELSVAGRSKRVLIAFAVMVAIQGIIQAFIVGAHRNGITGEIDDPMRLGMSMLTGEAIFLLISTVMIFPALSCTSISGEREAKTLPMLLMTPLATWEIVWGKMASSVAVASIFVVSSLPFLFFASTFPSVTMEGIALVLLGEFVLAAVISGFGMYCSVVFKRPIASMIAAYASAGISAWFLSALGPYLFVMMIWGGSGIGGGFRLVSMVAERPYVAIAMLLVLVVLYVSLFVLMTVARLKTRNQDRMSALRIFGTIATIVGVGLFIGTYFAYDRYTLDMAESMSLYAIIGSSIVAILSIVKGVGVDAYGSRASRKKFEKAVKEKPIKRFLWLWQPGAAQGYVLGLIIATVLLGSATLFSNALVTRAAEPMVSSNPHALGNALMSSGGFGGYDREWQAEMAEVELALAAVVESDPEVEEMIRATHLEMLTQRNDAHFQIFLMAMLCIAAFGMISWWLSLQTRRENTGGMVGLVSFWVVLLGPLLIGAIGSFSNDGPGDGIGSISPATGVVSIIDQSQSESTLAAYRELLIDAGLSEEYLDTTYNWSPRMSRGQSLSPLPSFFFVGIIGVVAMLLMLVARKKALEDREASAERWPPAKLPPARVFVASAQTPRVEHAEMVPPVSAPMPPPMPSASPEPDSDGVYDLGQDDGQVPPPPPSA